MASDDWNREPWPRVIDEPDGDMPLRFHNVSREDEMTDEELAKELMKTLRSGVWSTPADCPDPELAMARRARELCGMTAAERAVIEAALGWYGYTGKPGGWIPDSHPDRLENAISALRAERAPKPRFVQKEDVIEDTKRRVLYCVSGPTARTELTKLLNELHAAALNAAEQR